MRIQHNISAMNSYRNYNINAGSLNKNLEKLSSGYKINRAGDDAAGLAISEKMRAQISGLKQAQSNVKDGISLVKTAEGALQEVQDMMNRMVTLATQSANGTYDNEVDRANLQKEVEALMSEIDRIADSSNFNGQKLLNGELGISGEGDAIFGTTEISVSVSGLETTDADEINGDGVGHELNSAEITVKFGVDESADAGDIAVGFTTGGSEVTVTFGTKDAASTYTADEINAAIDNYIKSELDAGTISDEEAAALSTLTISCGDISLGANETDADVADATVTLADVAGIGKGLVLQIGDTADNYNKLTVNVGDMHTAALGISSVDVSTQDGAASAIQTIKNAINTVSATRGDLGAIQNRLEHTTNNLAVMTENIQDAESTIRDTDIADEMTTYTKNNILLQSAQAMLAQANQMPQGVLQLLQ